MPSPPTITITSVPVRKPRWIVGGVAGATVILAIVIVQHSWAGKRADSTTSLANATASEPITLRSASTEHERTPAKTERSQQEEETYTVPTVSIALDEKYPTLRDWVHPITAIDERVPANLERHFGALRHGIDRSECGRGHCGVDLHGPRGRAIVAVSDGVVVRAERRRDGGDGMSGRFVRLQHDDGTFTWYMHLDSLAPGLDVGNKVVQGQYLGTLGSTGVAANAPHLHFGLEIPNKGAKRIDTNNGHYIDPAPFLVRTRIIDQAERRKSIKPAS